MPAVSILQSFTSGPPTNTLLLHRSPVPVSLVCLRPRRRYGADRWKASYKTPPPWAGLQKQPNSTQRWTARMPATPSEKRIPNSPSPHCNRSEKGVETVGAAAVGVLKGSGSPLHPKRQRTLFLIKKRCPQTPLVVIRVCYSCFRVIFP